MHRLTARACLTVTLAVSACGTTVPLTQTVAGAPASTDSGIGVGSGPGGPSSPTYRQQEPNAPTSGTTGGASTHVTSAVPSGTSGTGGVAVPAFNGRGVTDTTVTIGIAVATGEEALANSFGISGADTVSARKVIDAVVEDVNTSGGVLGRKLAVYVHEFDASAAIANPEQAIAEICADFRDDHKVFAVVFDATLPSLRKCLATMGSPLIVRGGYTVMPAAAYTEHGGSFLYGTNAITAERLAELFIQSLMARSFTARWNTTTGGPGDAPVKLGVIHVDTPDQNALYAAYAKELAKHGLEFTDTVTYSQDASAALAATQSAVLRFRADGITHVFGASAFFLQDAESQRYRPRYAYLPGLGAIGADNSPPAQLKGALTVGWTPTSDVHDTEDPGDTAGATHCRAVMKGAALSTANRADLKTMYSYCDAILAFRDALTAGHGASVSGLRRGYEALGTRFRSALSFAVSMGPGRHNGIDSVRDMAYDSPCTCLKYTSRTNRS